MRGGRVDRIIDRSNRLYDKSLDAQSVEVKEEKLQG